MTRLIIRRLKTAIFCVILLFGVALLLSEPTSTGEASSEHSIRGRVTWSFGVLDVGIYELMGGNNASAIVLARADLPGSGDAVVVTARPKCLVTTPSDSYGRFLLQDRVRLVREE